MTKATAADGSKPAGMASNGVKLDAGKSRMDLLPPDALLATAGVFTFGAEKYAERNWELGMDWGRVFAAQQRHMNAFWGGEMYDPETGMMHTAHATFGTLVLTAYALRDIGADSRNPIVLGSANPMTKPVEARREIQYKPTRKGVELSAEDYQLLLKEAGRV